MLEFFVGRQLTAFMYDCCSAAVAALHSLRRMGLVQATRALVVFGLGSGMVEDLLIREEKERRENRSAFVITMFKEGRILSIGVCESAKNEGLCH